MRIAAAYPIMQAELVATNAKAAELQKAWLESVKSSGAADSAALESHLGVLPKASAQAE